jgi:hypothetical protein
MSTQNNIWTVRNVNFEAQVVERLQELLPEEYGQFFLDFDNWKEEVEKRLEPIELIYKQAQTKFKLSAYPPVIEDLPSQLEFFRRQKKQHRAETQLQYMPGAVDKDGYLIIQQASQDEIDEINKKSDPAVRITEAYTTSRPMDIWGRFEKKNKEDLGSYPTPPLEELKTTTNLTLVNGMSVEISGDQEQKTWWDDYPRMRTGARPFNMGPTKYIPPHARKEATSSHKIELIENSTSDKDDDRSATADTEHTNKTNQSTQSSTLGSGSSVKKDQKHKKPMDFVGSDKAYWDLHNYLSGQLLNLRGASSRIQREERDYTEAILRAIEWHPLQAVVRTSKPSGEEVPIYFYSVYKKHQAIEKSLLVKEIIDDNYIVYDSCTYLSSTPWECNQAYKARQPQAKRKAERELNREVAIKRLQLEKQEARRQKKVRIRKPIPSSMKLNRL